MPAKMKGQGVRAFLFRRFLIIFPYLLWLRLLDLKKGQWQTLQILFLFSMVVLLLFWERDEFKFKTSKMYANLSGPLNKTKYFANIFNLLAFVLGEEAFFRLGILSIIHSQVAVVLQALAFVGGHLLTPWGKSFQVKDLIRQLIFSLVVGIYFFETNNFILCVLAHLILNIPELIHLFHRLNLKTFEDEV
jgi:hypothetical protein